jgi:hypothetical protein
MPSTPKVSRQSSQEAKEYIGSVSQRRIPVVDQDLNDMTFGLYAQIRRSLEASGIHRIGDAFTIRESTVDTENNFAVNGGDGTAEGAGRAAFKGIRCLLKEDSEWVSAGQTDSQRSLLPQVTGVDVAVLTDATAKYTTGELVGRLLSPNVQKTEKFPIIANTATTITVDTSGVGLPLTDVAEPHDFYRVETSTPTGSGRTDSVWLNVAVQVWGAEDDPTIQHSLKGYKLEAAQRAKVRHTVHVREGLADYGAANQEYVDAFGYLHVVAKIAIVERTDSVDDILDADIRNLVPRMDGIQLSHRRAASFIGQFDLSDAAPDYVALISSKTPLAPDPATDFSDYVATAYIANPSATIFTAGAGTIETSLVGVGVPAVADDFWINTWLEIDISGTGAGPFEVERVTDYDSGTSTFSLAGNVRGLIPGSKFTILGDSLGQACAKLDRTLRRMNIDASEAIQDPPVVPGTNPSALLISRGARDLGNILGETPRWDFATGFAGAVNPNWNFLALSATANPNPGYLFNRSFDNKYHNVILGIDDAVKAMGVLLGLNTELSTSFGVAIPATTAFSLNYSMATPSTFKQAFEDMDLSLQRLALIKIGESVEFGTGGAASTPTWPTGFTTPTVPASAHHHDAIQAINVKIGDVAGLAAPAESIIANINRGANRRIEVDTFALVVTGAAGGFISPGETLLDIDLVLPTYKLFDAKIEFKLVGFYDNAGPPITRAGVHSTYSLEVQRQGDGGILGTWSYTSLTPQGYDVGSPAADLNGTEGVFGHPAVSVPSAIPAGTWIIGTPFFSPFKFFEVPLEVIFLDSTSGKIRIRAGTTGFIWRASGPSVATPGPIDEMIISGRMIASFVP